MFPISPKPSDLELLKANIFWTYLEGIISDPPHYQDGIQTPEIL